MIPDCFYRTAERFKHINQNVMGVDCSILSSGAFPTSTFVVLVRDGVYYEPRELWGVSHFIEHILFRGTEKHPTLFDISRAVEGIGGRISAFSTRNFVSYWIKAPSGKEERALEILQDLIARPGLDAGFIEKEKQIIVQERFREINNPSFYNSILMEEILLSPEPISRRPIGSDEVINGLDEETIRRHMNKHYHKGNVTFGACGDIPEEFIDKIKDFISGLPDGDKPEPADFKTDKDYSKGSVFHLKSHHKSQAYLSMGWKMEKEDLGNIFAWRVLNSLLGSGYTSLLNKVLREDENITYLCTTRMNQYAGSGVYKINMALSAKNAKRALELVERILNDVAGKKIDPDIFKEAVIKHASHILFQMESTLETAKILTQNILKEGAPFDLKGYLKRLSEVTVDDVAAIVQKRLQTKDRKILIQTGAEGVNEDFLGVELLAANH